MLPGAILALGLVLLGNDLGTTLVMGATVIGAMFFWVAVRRLRIPYSTLPKGTRVA